MSSLVRQDDNGRAAATAMSLICAVLLAVLDAHGESPLFPAPALIIAGLALGILCPRCIFRWAAILAGALVIGNLLRMPLVYESLQSLESLRAIAAFVSPTKTSPPSPISALVSFAPALASAYLGRRVREVSRTLLGL